jgi:hypothetical protein
VHCRIFADPPVAVRLKPQGRVWVCSSACSRRRPRTRPLVLEILPAIAGNATDSSDGLERLARRYFELFHAETLPELRDVLHPDALIELQAVQPGVHLHGRDEIVAVLEQEFSQRLWETVVHVCTPIDESRIVAEGRIRWMDDERVMRDEARVWGLEFRDGLLLRSVPARNAVEAEALLSAAPQSGFGDGASG